MTIQAASGSVVTGTMARLASRRNERLPAAWAESAARSPADVDATSEAKRRRQERRRLARLEPVELPDGGVFTRAEAARYLRLSIRTLEARSDIPAHDVRPPGTAKACWRYIRSELDAWVARHTFGGHMTEERP